MVSCTKTFEIRDRGTFIVAIAFKVTPACEDERYLMARAGFGRDIGSQAEYTFLYSTSKNECHYDPYNWCSGRTYGVAHQYISEKWDELKGGEVIDVEFILKETETKKLSERLTT